MKTSVIDDEFRARFLSNPDDPDAFEGRAIVFDGPEDYHHRIDDPKLKIDEHSILFIRGTGPIGYPGGAEVVNMQPPAALIKKGVHALPCVGDGRQSGTSGSPSILNASPEAAAGGGLALLKTGDRVRIDLNKRAANILISEAELNERRAALAKHGGYDYPKSQTPWQQIQREMVAQFDEGMVLEAGDQVPAPRANDRRAEGQSLTGAATGVYTSCRLYRRSPLWASAFVTPRSASSPELQAAQDQHDRGDRPCASQRTEARTRQAAAGGAVGGACTRDAGDGRGHAMTKQEISGQ